jgi:hypothetical protein
MVLAEKNESRRLRGKVLFSFGKIRDEDGRVFAERIKFVEHSGLGLVVRTGHKAFDAFFDDLKRRVLLFLHSLKRRCSIG